ELFSDIGIGPSIIQNRRGDDPDFLNTAWTLQLCRGLALTCCAAALSWPVAHLWFHKPELTPLMMTAGATPLVLGLYSAKLFSANRQLDLGRITFLDLFAQGSGLAVIVVLALAYRSVWALVIGGLLGSAIKMVLSHVVLPGPNNRPRWNATIAPEMIGFGRWIFPSSAVNFLAAQGDRLLIGRYAGEALLGIYSVAFMLSDATARLVSTVGQRALFPAFGSVIRSDPGRLGLAYDRV